MPKPKSNERKPEFIQRCIDQLTTEGKTKDQAVATCYSMWDQYKGLQRYNKLKSFIRYTKNN